MDRLGQIQPEPSIAQTGKEDEARDASSQIFLNQIEQSRSQINTFTNNTKNIKGMHDMLLRNVEPTQQAQIQQSIDERTAENNQLGQEIGRMLKSLTTETQEQEKAKQISSSVARIRFNLASSCSSNFSKQIQAFQQVQVRAKAEYGEHLKRQYLLVNPKATPQEIEQIVQGGAEAQQSMFESANRMEAQRALDSVNERHKSIQRLEQSLVNLHRLFVDMQMLVQLQGKMIDKIDTNVENVAEYTEESAVTMEKAVEYQKAAWKQKSFFLIMLLIVIGVLAFWFFK